MPSFDIVSELNRQEVDNAVNQAQKEILTRYDFKGSKTSITLEKDSMTLVSDNEEKMKAVVDIVCGKMAKRGISLKALDRGPVTEAGGMTVRCVVKLISGIETEKAKELVKTIKGTGIKVQAAIEGEKLRVSGKKRDDLQEVIQFLRSHDLPIPLQFNNFRD